MIRLEPNIFAFEGGEREDDPAGYPSESSCIRVFMLRHPAICCDIHFLLGRLVVLVVHAVDLHSQRHYMQRSHRRHLEGSGCADVRRRRGQSGGGRGRVGAILLRDVKITSWEVELGVSVGDGEGEQQVLPNPVGLKFEDRELHLGHTSHYGADVASAPPRLPVLSFLLETRTLIWNMWCECCVFLVDRGCLGEEQHQQEQRHRRISRHLERGHAGTPDIDSIQL